MFRAFTPAAFALAAVLTASVSASAAPISVSGDDEKVSVKVTYTDSDLQNPRGAEALAFRIRLAASEVCGGGNIVVRSGAHFPICRSAAIDRALGVLNAPMVTAALGRSTSSMALAQR